MQHGSSTFGLWERRRERLELPAGARNVELIPEPVSRPEEGQESFFDPGGDADLMTGMHLAHLVRVARAEGLQEQDCQESLV